MKILLTGANGQVGYELWRTLQHLGEVIPTTRKGIEIEGMPTIALDMSDANDIEKKINAIAPDIICNTAAYTAVDQAETDQELAHQINAIAPAIFAKYTTINDTHLIHYSTDYVFSGKSTVPWVEDDNCDPQGVYGDTKLLGEHAIIDTGCNHTIFRTAWVFSARGHNFIKSMLNLATKHDELSIVDDQIGSPTWATSIAIATTMSLQNPMQGTYHMTSSGKTSWCGFARKIFAQAHQLKMIDKMPIIHAISTDQYPTPASRPSYSVLNCKKLKNDFGIHMPNWQTALQLCMQHMRRES